MIAENSVKRSYPSPVVVDSLSSFLLHFDGHLALRNIHNDMDHFLAIDRALSKLLVFEFPGYHLGTETRRLQNEDVKRHSRIYLTMKPFFYC